MSDEEEESNFADYFKCKDGLIKCLICRSIYTCSPYNEIAEHLTTHEIVVNREDEEIFLNYIVSMQYFDETKDGFQCKFCDQKYFLISAIQHLKDHKELGDFCRLSSINSSNSSNSSDKSHSI